jgi:hypothetical protein
MAAAGGGPPQPVRSPRRPTPAHPVARARHGGRVHRRRRPRPPQAVALPLARVGRCLHRLRNFNRRCSSKGEPEEEHGGYFGHRREPIHRLPSRAQLDQDREDFLFGAGKVLAAATVPVTRPEMSSYPPRSVPPTLATASQSFKICACVQRGWVLCGEDPYSSIIPDGFTPAGNVTGLAQYCIYGGSGWSMLP